MEVGIGIIIICLFTMAGTLAAIMKDEKRRKKRYEENQND